MTEVPIQFLQDDSCVVRGVIDLVFRQDGGGWVIVDYKTDDHSAEAIDGLVEKYAGQVRMYADAWTELAGEPVSETGLFFVRTGQYRVV